MRLTFATLALSSLLFGAPSLAKNGCNKAIPSNVTPGTTTDVLEIDNSSSGRSTRKYRLHIPKDYDASKQYPLILSFHGRTKDAENQVELSQFTNASYGYKGISVFPQAFKSKTPDGKEVRQWQGDPDAPMDINDVTFTFELLDYLESTFCIDKNKIYASGKSNGGGFTGILACDPQASKRFAAFAVVSGAFYLDDNDMPAACNPGRSNVPVAEFHGFADNTIKYGGGPRDGRGDEKTESIVTYVKDWVKRNKIQDPVRFEPIGHLCSGDKLVTQYGWGGKNNDLVMHYNYTNVAHDWMSSFANVDTDNPKRFTCKEAEATSLILDWYKQWTLAGHV